MRVEVLLVVFILALSHARPNQHMLDALSALANDLKRMDEQTELPAPVAEITVTDGTDEETLPIGPNIRDDDKALHVVYTLQTDGTYEASSLCAKQVMSRKEFRRETDAARALISGNTHVASAQEWTSLDATSGPYYVILPYLDGYTDFKTIDEKRQSEEVPWNPTVEQAVGIVNQLAGALRWIHEQGVAHADFHEGNFMLNAEFDAQIIDWDDSVLAVADYGKFTKKLGYQDMVLTNLTQSGLLAELDEAVATPPFSTIKTSVIRKRHATSTLFLTAKWRFKKFIFFVLTPIIMELKNTKK